MSRSRLLAVVIVAGAAALRLSGIGWDGWHHQHPDERFLVMVAERLAAPRSLGEALDPARTPANPNNRGFDFYVYGALPPVATAAVAGAIGMKSYGGLLIVGRFLAVLADLVALGLVMALATRLGGRTSGLLAGALYAACALVVQQSRFGTCDVWGVACVLALAWAVVGRPLTTRALATAGVALGLAVACRPNLALAAVIPLVAVVVAAVRGGESFSGGRTAEGREAASSAWRALGRAVRSLAVVGALAFVTLKLADPGAFAATASPLPSPRRLAALRQVSLLSEGSGQYPPSLQWADRRPVLEPLGNLLVWGTGPALGLAVLLGLGFQIRRAALGSTTWLPVLAWALPMAAWHLSKLVCSVRYFEPLLPFGIVAAAVWLARRRRRWFAALVLIATALWGLAWAALAWRPYTRVEASRWLRDNLPAGATITSEYWDDALPLPGEGPDRVRVVETTVFAPDTEEKREQLLAALAQADAVVLASQRGVGAISRVPDAYPLTSEYYRLLFSGALGFDLAASFERRIGAGWLALSDLTAEESLSVYDHPPVWVFRKNPAYRDDLARALLERVELPRRVDWSTAQLEARGTPPYLERWHEAGGLPGRWAPSGWEQAMRALLWVLAVELAGLLGGRLLRRLGASLPDDGWGVARWLGLALVGLAWLLLGWAAAPGWNRWLPPLVFALALPWGAGALRRAWSERSFRVAALLFWATFAAFLAVRAWNPEMYWGEKPMDASLLAGIWRAERLPPVDPWFAGAPLNYYYFGFLPFAALGRACGAGLGVTFNLAVATVPALAFACASSLGWLLSRRLAGGVLAGLLAQVVGTAGVAFHSGLVSHPDFNRFWATSRVIGTTINEYPVWTALFADLHAHFLGFPGFLAGMLVATAVALRRIGLRAGALLGGAIVAVEAMGNTWELPVLALLLATAALAAPVTAAIGRRLVQCGRFLAHAALAATVLSLPYWSTVRQPASSVMLTTAATPPATAYAELFGVIAALALVAAIATFLAPVRDRALVWGWCLVGVGIMLVWAPEVVTIADRMNTTFKLHLQAHLILGAALGGLIAALLPALPRRWRLPLAAAAALALALGFATTLGDVRAVLATRRVPGPRPTLDGAAYLRELDPAQAKALATLASAGGRGTVVETAGPPYSDSMRVPMFTGMPGLVGWEYHLWQRNHAASEIGQRQRDLDVLLAGGDEGVVAALSRRYRVGVACGWDGDEPAVGRLPGWRLEVSEGGAFCSVAPADRP